MRGLLLALGVLALGHCGGEVASERLAMRSSALGLPSALYTTTPSANLSWTGASPKLFEIESTSALIPPGADTVNCPEGRMYMSHGRGDAFGGVSRLVDRLPLLSNPQTHVVAGPVSNGATPGTDQIIDEYPTLPSDTILGAFKFCLGGSCSCISGGTAPRYLRSGTDTYTVRAGPSTILQMVAAMEYKPGNISSDCHPLPVKAVNIVRRSTNCGVNWTTSVLNAGGFESKFYSNADLPYMYVDRNDTSRVFIVGGSGPPVAGVLGQVLWKSSDNGQTWTPKYSPKNSSGTTAYLSAYAMTSTSAGTLVLAGCGPSSGNSNDAGLFVYYSKDDGEFWEGPLTQPIGVSNCGSIFGSADSFNANYMPGYLKRKPHGGAGTYVSLSRVKPSGNFSTVRMAYTSRENDSGGVSTSQRQVMKIVGIDVPSPGGPPVLGGMTTTATIRPAGLDDSIFIGTYIETDAFGPATETDTAMFWWLEGRHSDDSYTGKYFFHTGPSTFSRTYQLTTNADGSPFRWVYNVPSCRNDTPGGGPPDGNGYTNLGHWMCWLGEYERGAFWYEGAANKLHFAPQWTGSSPGVTGTHNYYHFNEITVTP